jgi:hypothetical protein
MTLRHPLDRIRPGRLRIPLVVHVVALAVLWLVLPAVLPFPNFERLSSLVLAGSVERATAVVATWSEADRLRVAFWGGFDFLVDVVAFNALALACIWASRVFAGSRLATFGPLLAWACWLGVVLNLPENAAFIHMTLAPVAAPWPTVAVASAYPRLVIMMSALVYVALAGLARLRGAGRTA